MKRPIYTLFVILAIASAGTAQIRICTYNVLNFPGSTGSERIPHFQTVLDEIQPDLLVCQEMVDNSGAQQFFEGVLDTAVYDRAAWVTQGTSEYMLYYKQDLFSLVDIYTVLTDLRNWEIYELEYIGGGSRPHLYIATSHLKASQGSDNEYRRLIECEALLDWLNLNPLTGNNLLVCGDFNFYFSGESGYQALLAASTFIDPIDTPGDWHDNVSFADVHTQSPRVTSFGGGATGGMDDRFDFELVTPQLMDGEEWEYIEGSYTSYGNDGQHFNQAINNPPNLVVPQGVADALHDATDHLPVYLDIEYVESTPVEVVLTPINPPVLIPAAGGDLNFDVFVENVSLSPQDFDAWLASEYEGGDPVSLVIRSFSNYQPGWSINRPGMYYPIPGSWAAGNYMFWGRAGVEPGDVWDESGFPFEKLGEDHITGFVPFPVEDAPNPFDATVDREIERPVTITLNASPNPFNPSTVISFQLSVVSKVDLAVYDVAGRKVTDLVNGWRDAGVHEVAFDGSGLASGVYLYRLSIGGIEVVGKMMLIK